MNCLIIEDEKEAAIKLSGLIKKYDEDIDILNTIQTVKNAVLWINNHETPDLIFMDIQLADGLSFEIFEQTIVKAPIIFITAFDEYALKAFKVNSIDYLLKPIDQLELTQAIDKYKENKFPKEISTQIFDNILHTLTKKYKSKFLIKFGEQIKIFPIEDIQCFYSMEKYTFLQNNAGRDYAIGYSLDQLENLIDPSKFFRINRRFLVSISAISDIVSYSNSRLLIKLKENDSKDLVVSREKVPDFKKWLESWLNIDLSESIPLIEKWDFEHNTFDDSDPIELLKTLMAEHNLKAKDLVEILHLSKGTISQQHRD